MSPQQESQNQSQTTIRDDENPTCPTRVATEDVSDEDDDAGSFVSAMDDEDRQRVHGCLLERT